MKILITGANGYIGSALMCAFKEKHEVIGLVRHSPGADHSYLLFNDICAVTAADVSGFECVIHASGMAEVTAEGSELHRVNVEGAKAIASACREAGVERLINLSSVKAAGEGSVGSRVLDQPTSAYGQSKLQAEKAINALLEGSKTRAVHLRFPLAYGPGVQNNFKKLIGLSGSKLPLPLASLTAQRSYCFVGNLIRLIERQLASPTSESVVYVADPEPLTLPKLLAGLSKVQGLKLRLMWFPEVLLQLVVRLVKPSYANQLFGDAVVDISATQKAFPEWRPILTLDALEFLEIGRDGRI
jgi:nucleoside-diphosphate-sugar epimerase